MRAKTIKVLLCLVLASGCRCTNDHVYQAAPAELAVEPSVVEPLVAYVGSRTTQPFTVTNRGGSATEVDLWVEASSFALSTSHLRLPVGESATVELVFAPTQLEDLETHLHVDTLSIALHGVSVAIPECTASSVCTTNNFDTATAQCLEATKPDGAACTTRCVSGQCVNGTCRGTYTPCDDADACTVDACSDASGCTHEPRSCPPPTDPCQVTRCDSTTGCTFEAALDGTLCGPDDCLATNVNVCLAGQCVARPRPAGGRCSNRWVPATLPVRMRFGLAYDAARARTVLFGGASAAGSIFGDTWEWDGSHWLQRFPTASPSPRESPQMFYDSNRQRVVIIGDDERWEWDGATWLRLPGALGSAHGSLSYDDRRHRVLSPFITTEWSDAGTFIGYQLTVSESDGLGWQAQSAIRLPDHAASLTSAFDSLRETLVVVVAREPASWSGSLPPLLTYEWNGSAWRDASSSDSPSGRWNSQMAFDADRGRVVLWGGTPGVGLTSFTDTWEWDGTSWLKREFPSSPPAHTSYWPAAMAYDTARHRLVLVGATVSTDVWELGGQAWQSITRSPGFEFARSIAYDPVRQRVVLIGGVTSSFEPTSDTWEWNGATWLEHTPPIAPASRGWASLAPNNDGTVTLFGGWPGATDDGVMLADTWKWNGTTWATVATLTSPQPRSQHATSFDSTRNRLVLFGGRGTKWLGDTWEFDGTTWLLRTPTHSPSPRSNHSLAYDSARARTVLFGGSAPAANGSSTLLDDTWEWDGTDWLELTPPTKPRGQFNHSMAYDSARQRVMPQYGDGTRTETWEWDGANWTQRAPLVSPPVERMWYRRPSVMTYDAERKHLTLVQGADTWLFVP